MRFFFHVQAEHYTDAAMFQDDRRRMCRAKFVCDLFDKHKGTLCMASLILSSIENLKQILNNQAEHQNSHKLSKWS